MWLITYLCRNCRGYLVVALVSPSGDYSLPDSGSSWRGCSACSKCRAAFFSALFCTAYWTRRSAHSAFRSGDLKWTRKLWLWVDVSFSSSSIVWLCFWCSKSSGNQSCLHRTAGYLDCYCQCYWKAQWRSYSWANPWKIRLKIRLNQSFFEETRCKFKLNFDGGGGQKYFKKVKIQKKNYLKSYDYFTFLYL